MFDELPLVTHLLTKYPIDLKGVYILGGQHILNTTLSMFKSLFQRGLRPENVSLMGKCYSTSRSVLNEMLRMGMDVCDGSCSFNSHSPYDRQYRQLVKFFIKSRLARIDQAKPKLVIVMDDGGTFLKSIDLLWGRQWTVVGLEQTSSGFEAIKDLDLPYQVVNVARSKSKLIFESPMIANVAECRMNSRLEKLELRPQRCLIIGAGAIGMEMYRLMFTRFPTSIFDVDATKLQYSRIDLPKALQVHDLIIGCTGKISVPRDLHKYIHPRAVLVSVSSSDREFDAAAIRKKCAQPIHCHDDLCWGERHLLNCGFPINFDGTPHSVAPQFIQMTRALLVGAIIQLVRKQVDRPFTGGLDNLETDIQETVIHNAEKLGIILTKSTFSPPILSNNPKSTAEVRP